MKYSLISLLLFLLLIKVAKAQETKPNIVFVLADDMGIGDLGCYGGKKIYTPNIDALSEKGVQFMQHYSGATVCAPSRCSLITGKHTGNTTIRGNKGVETNRGTFDMPILESDISVAEILKAEGYRTMCVGKWGLGGPSTSGSPTNKGFDYFFGYLSQGAAHRYYPEYLFENEEKVFFNKKIYSQYEIMDRGLNFIKQNSDSPFFAYFALTPPHADLDIPELGEYANAFHEVPYINNKARGYISQSKPKAAYAALVSEVDRSVGLIIELLKEEGIYDNTIVIFSSDNGVHNVGGHDPLFFNSNGSFRGNKRDLYEGGIRTPFIVSWPAKANPHYTYHTSAFWDFLPTVCDIIGVKVPKESNGISYLPQIVGKGKQKQHQYIYHEFHEQGGKQSIIRTKDGWKLVRLNVNKPNKTKEELYNIYHDAGEVANMINQYPNIAKELASEIDKQRTCSAEFSFVTDN